MTSRGTTVTPVWRVLLFGLLIAVPLVVLGFSVAEGYLVEEVAIDVVAWLLTVV